VIFTLVGIAGFGLIALVPFAAQSLAETVFPIKETLVVNFMLYFAQIVGLVGNSIGSAAFVGHHGIWVLVAMMCPGVIYIVFKFKTTFNRRKLEHQLQRSHSGNQGPVEMNLVSQISSPTKQETTQSVLSRINSEIVNVFSNTPKKEFSSTRIIQSPISMIKNFKNITESTGKLDKMNVDNGNYSVTKENPEDLSNREKEGTTVSNPNKDIDEAGFDSEGPSNINQVYIMIIPDSNCKRVDNQIDEEEVCQISS